MLLGPVLAGIAFAAVPVGGAGALGEAGERLGDAVITGVETHPEYERYALRQPDGRVAVAELTTGSGGLCDTGGLTVFPRADLADGVTTTVGMDGLCARLAERTPTLRARIGPGGKATDDAGPTDGAGADDGAARGAEGGPSDARAPGRREIRAPMVYSPLTLALVALLGIGAARVRLDRTLLAVGLAALGARLSLAPRGVVNGAMAGYEKLVLARGTVAGAPYGEGWGAVMGLVPGWPDGVFWATCALASASAVLLAAVVRSLAGPRAGLAAGLLFAVLPTHVGVSVSETMHVAVLAFELASALAILAWARSRSWLDGLAAALAAGMAVHIRPDALPFVAVPLVWAWLTRGALTAGPGAAPTSGRLTRLAAHPVAWLGAPLAVLAALVGWRVATLEGAPGGLLQGPSLSVLWPRFGEATGESSFQLFLHAGMTPPLLWGLAGVGAAMSWREGRRSLVGWLAVWIALTTLPVSAKVMPLVDAVRLQLPGQAPWIALAGIGAAHLPRWVLPLALLACLPYFPLRPWVQTEEWTFLRTTVPSFPAGTTVRYDARPQRAESFAGVMESLGPATWSAEAGDLRYVGLDCLGRGGCDTSGCVAERVTVLEGRVDLDLSLEGRTIGFWRCPTSAGDAGEMAPAEGAP